MDEKPCVLRVPGLEKSFDGDPVLRGIDLDVYQGDVISVIGPSGSGKSTLIRCIDFLEEPDRGSVILDGTDYADPSVSELQPVCQPDRIGELHAPFDNGQAAGPKDCQGHCLGKSGKSGDGVLSASGRVRAFRRAEAEGGHCQGAVYGTPAHAV